MPIKGLTDKAPSFPRIGVLRKGSPKQDNKSGKDLDYFRFTSDSTEVSQKFLSNYGDKPREINCFLPYNTTDENFHAWREEWVASGLVHRCDGEYVVLYQDKGKYVTPPPNTIKCKGGCKQVGRLSIIIPELGHLAYVTALTTSVNDIIELSSNLNAYEVMRNGNLQGIPFILRRVKRAVSTPEMQRQGNNYIETGKRVKREKWLLSIEANSNWVQHQLAYMQSKALPAHNKNMYLPESIETIEGEVVDEQTGEITNIVDNPSNHPKSTPKPQKQQTPREWLASQQSLTYATVQAAMLKTGKFENASFAMDMISQYPSYPPDYEPTIAMKIGKVESALNVFDWCVSNTRKEGSND